MKKNQQKTVVILAVVGAVLLLVGILGLSGAFRPSTANDGKPMDLVSWSKHLNGEPKEHEFGGIEDENSTDRDLESAVVHVAESLDDAFENTLTGSEVASVKLVQMKDDGSLEDSDVFTDNISVTVELEDGSLSFFQVPLEEGISIAVDIDKTDPTSYLVTGWHVESDTYNSPDDAITYDSEDGVFCDGEPVPEGRC